MYNPVTVRSADGRPFAKDNSFALLTGVGRRAADSEHMVVTATDADMMRRALVGSFQLFDEKKVTTLINGEATAANIIAELDKLTEVTKITKADFVIVYFSGHGYEQEGNYFLIANDTSAWTMADNNIEVSELAKKINAIEAAEFAAKLKSINCNKMLVLLDCCHSAGMTMKPLNEDSFKDCPNRVILTACGKGQVSYLSKPVSIFTYALIETLGGKFLSGTDTVVTIFSLGMAVSSRVSALSKMVLDKNAVPQRPEMDVLENNQTFNYPVARYLKGGPQEIRLLKEEIKSISTEDGAKQFDPDSIGQAEPDENFKQKFSWLENKITQTITTNITGDNNNITNTNQAILGDNNTQINVGPMGKFTLVTAAISDPKETLQRTIDTWASSFKEEDEKGLEKQINNINNIIDNIIDNMDTP